MTILVCASSLFFALVLKISQARHWTTTDRAAEADRKYKNTIFVRKRTDSRLTETTNMNDSFKFSSLKKREERGIQEESIRPRNMDKSDLVRRDETRTSGDCVFRRVTRKSDGR